LRCIPALPRSVCRLAVASIVLVAVPLMSGCDFLDDIQGWNKKPLPGDRKALFPEGVPGVSTGLPPDLQKGYRETSAQAPDPASAAAAAAAEETAARPRPKSIPRPAGTLMQPGSSSGVPRQSAAKSAVTTVGQSATTPANSSAPPRKTAKPLPQGEGTRQAAAPAATASGSQPQSAPLPWPSQPQAAWPANSGTVAR
jgi:hypothetical protein